MSSTGVYLAFGDSEGTIHLMTAAEEAAVVPFNGFEGQPVEWADIPEPLPELDWTASTCVTRLTVVKRHFNIACSVR